MLYISHKIKLLTIENSNKIKYSKMQFKKTNLDPGINHIVSK